MTAETLILLGRPPTRREEGCAEIMGIDLRGGDGSAIRQCGPDQVVDRRASRGGACEVRTGDPAAS